MSRLSMPSSAHSAICLACIFTLAVASAHAQSPQAEVLSFLQERDRDIKRAVSKLGGGVGTAEDRRRAEALINDRIDFREMGRLSLGKYWADLSADQRADFVDTFRAIVRGQSLSDLTVYEAAVTFESVEVTDDKAHVYTTATIDGAKVEVSYLLRRVDGEWWLYDIILDDVGTVEGYSISFQSYIRKRGFESFMASLNKKRASLDAGG